jgi:hypothetical protein
MAALRGHVDIIGVGKATEAMRADELIQGNEQREKHRKLMRNKP